MALLATKTCKYIRPDSVDNASAEAYEYFLVWISPDGGVYCWLFEDFELRKDIDSDLINTKSDNISKLYRNANREINLIAEDLTENEFDTLSDITRALVVRRYYKDGTYDPLAILTDRIRKSKSQFRYNLEIQVAEKEDNLMK